MTSILDSLSAAQQAAARHVDGPLLILAGPGSGKTRVITHRIAYLLDQGIPDSQILALTFTNKAADEMKNRLLRLTSGQQVWLGTFHRFCAQQLRRFAPLVGLTENFSILDARDSLAVVRDLMRQLTLTESGFTPELIAKQISAVKSEAITHDVYEPHAYELTGAVMRKIYPAYAARLLADNAVDFDDLLLHFVAVLRENPELRASLDRQFSYIMVDEYQDTNLAQYSIARALSIDFPNLAVTGDPDQSIYGWRGANLNNILEFENDFPDVSVVRLEQNYRSTRSIVNAAQALIERNCKRKDKTHFTLNEPGAAVRLVGYNDHREEAQAIALQIATSIAEGRRSPRDFAVLYRANWLSRILEESMRAHRLPYQIVHGIEFYSRQEVRDILAYLQFLNNQRNSVALKRIINTPARSIGSTTVERLERFAAAKRMTLWDACRQAGTISELTARSAVHVAKFVALVDRLQLLTMHSVSSLISAVVEQTGYSQALQQSQDPEADERIANLDELLNAARDFEQNEPDPTLDAFLEQSALVNDTDDLHADDRVTLMTMHAAKGLEFSVVYIIALEEGLIPHRRRDTDDCEEEERRLLFVGMTRAREELILSSAKRRPHQGVTRNAIPSSFLMELPRSDMELVNIASAPIVDEYANVDSYAADDAVESQAFFADEPSFDIGDSAQLPLRSPKPAATRTTSTPKLTTAADLFHSDAQSPPSSLSRFRKGVLVTHPDYGVGTVVHVAGEFEKMVAAVRFFHNPRIRKFVVQNSQLTTVQSFDCKDAADLDAADLDAADE